MGVRPPGEWTPPTEVEEPVRLLARTVYRGANVYHRETVIRHELELAPGVCAMTGQVGPEFASAFVDRFVAGDRMIPNARCDDRFLQRLHTKTGVSIGEALLEAVLCLDAIAAYHRFDLRAVAFARVDGGTTPRRLQLVRSTRFPSLAHQVARVAVAAVCDLLEPTAARQFHYETGLQSLLASARRRRMSTTISVILAAAADRRVPSRWLGGPHVRLGEGAAQRLTYASVPADTAMVATQLARDKRRAARRLAAAGIPVPMQARAGTMREALAFIRKIGGPVVVKPVRGNQGGGVSVGVREPAELAVAFGRAKGEGAGVMVEAMAAGATYRMLVFGARCVAAVHIEPPSVIGDGDSTIADLIARLNEDPLRNEITAYPIALDPGLRDHLARFGYGWDYILAEGERLLLCSAANVALGGLHRDVTDRVHMANRKLAVRAAQALGLSVAGIDFVTPDIGRSYRTVGGAVVEVNARPGLCMHHSPRYGPSRDVGGEMIELCLGPDNDGRLPSAVVLGEQGANAVALGLDDMLRARGQRTGLVVKSGCYVNGEMRVGEGPQWKRCQSLLNDPQIQTLVLAVSPAAVMARGLGLDTVSAVAILAPTLRVDRREWRRGAAAVIEVCQGPVVVDAAALRALAPSGLPASRIIMIARPGYEPHMRQHAANGGAIVACDDAGIWYRCGARGAVALAPSGDSNRSGRSRPYAAALLAALDEWAATRKSGRRTNQAELVGPLGLEPRTKGL